MVVAMIWIWYSYDMLRLASHANMVTSNLMKLYLEKSWFWWYPFLQEIRQCGSVDKFCSTKQSKDLVKNPDPNLHIWFQTLWWYDMETYGDSRSTLHTHSILTWCPHCYLFIYPLDDSKGRQNPPKRPPKIGPSSYGSCFPAQIVRKQKHGSNKKNMCKPRLKSCVDGVLFVFLCPFALDSAEFLATGQHGLQKTLPSPGWLALSLPAVPRGRPPVDPIQLWPVFVVLYSAPLFFWK